MSKELKAPRAPRDIKDLKAEEKPVHAGMGELYEISTDIVSSMWHSFSYAEGVLLTQAEAILGDDVRCKAYKNMLKRELRRLQQNVQDTIYEKYRQQTPKDNFSEPILAFPATVTDEEEN